MTGMKGGFFSSAHAWNSEAGQRRITEVIINKFELSRPNGLSPLSIVAPTAVMSSSHDELGYTYSTSIEYQVRPVDIIPQYLNLIYYTIH